MLIYKQISIAEVTLLAIPKHVYLEIISLEDSFLLGRYNIILLDQTSD